MVSIHSVGFFHLEKVEVLSKFHYWWIDGRAKWAVDAVMKGKVIYGKERSLLPITTSRTCESYPSGNYWKGKLTFSLSKCYL